MAVGVDDVEEADDARVIHFFEQGDLADSRRWYALVFSLQANLLESEEAPRSEILNEVDVRETALAQQFYHFVLAPIECEARICSEALVLCVLLSDSRAAHLARRSSRSMQ